MKRIIIIIFVASVFLFSCVNKETKVKIDKIDSLLIQIDSLSYELEQVKIDSLRAVYSVTKSNNEFFQNNNFDMPEDKAFIKDFGGYGLVGKNLKRLLGSYNTMNTDIEYSKKQLINLRHDIKKELLTNSDTINRYIIDEEEAVNNIKVNLLPKIQLLNKQLPLYYKTHKRIENFKKKIELRIKN
ncbi:MAG: hypothetical protein KAG95_04395 [Bacteroidales bacterium]|nr:hypothetical protein [Bacteroidales bacterium]